LQEIGPSAFIKPCQQRPLRKQPCTKPCIRSGLILVGRLGVMNIRTQLILLWVSIGISIAGCGSNQSSVAQVSLATLPTPTDTYGSSETLYRVDAYIEAASRLQAMGKQAACERLLVMGDTQEFTDCDKMAVLCRMLFTERSGSGFIRPSLGGAVFIGGTHYSDWPLEPIEIIDGVPFIIVRGYSMFGAPERPYMYVRYCMTNCDWSSLRFKPKTEEQKKKALAKLIASQKWQRPLEQEDRDFFAAQIQ